jgi:crotonobetainyl-CoA:carnitine CoA-transferase CaiB-like acyl-CoA transferase
VYDAADGYIAIFCVTDKHWRRLLGVLDREDLKGDSRYDTNLKRVEHMDEIDAMIEEETRTLERDVIAERLRDAEVPCGPVKTLPEVADDPHLRERGMIQRVDHPNYDGEINAHGSPIRLSNAEEPDITPSPTKGEDNAAVYARRLGLSEAEIRELEREDII